jgi:hypothetical protein
MCNAARPDIKKLACSNHPFAELFHVWTELFFGDEVRRPGRHMNHPIATAGVDDFPLIHIIASGKDVDFVTEQSQISRNLGDVNILSAAIHSADAS